MSARCPNLASLSSTKNPSLRYRYVGLGSVSKDPLSHLLFVVGLDSMVGMLVPLKGGIGGI